MHEKNSDTKSNYGDGTGDFALWDRSKSRALSKKEKTGYVISNSQFDDRPRILKSSAVVADLDLMEQKYLGAPSNWLKPELLN